MEESKSKKTHRWSLIGAVAAAIAASACCIGPIILIGLGISGASVGALSAMEPFRPFLIGFTVLALGFAFWRVYRKRAAVECGPDGTCTPKSKRGTKIGLWSITIVAALLLAAPTMIGWLGDTTVKNAAASTTPKSQTAKVTLKITKMTCGSCTVGVTKALAKTKGVLTAKVTYKPPQAVITYDKRKAKVGDLEAAITKLGYPARRMN